MQVAALERLVCLVQAGSRTVQLVTPAFQLSHSAELQRRFSFPFGSLRLPRGPLGGFATWRTPLAAVAARGAEDNINDSDDDSTDVILFSSFLLLSLSLLCTSAIGCSAIEDLETFLYSPLRGNILGRASLCVGAWALYRALVRPEGRASFSDFSAGTEDLAPGRAWHKVSGTVYKHL